MSLPRKPKDIQVRLPVCVQPGQTVIEVNLQPNTTAGDIVQMCCSSEQIHDRPQSPTFTQPQWCILVADFQGYEKRFTTDERVYQLVRKHILLAGNTQGVRFYLRKKKKRSSLCEQTQQEHESLTAGDFEPMPTLNELSVLQNEDFNCKPMESNNNQNANQSQIYKLPNMAIYDSLQRSLLKKRAVMQQQSRARATVLPQPPPQIYVKMAHNRAASALSNANYVPQTQNYNGMQSLHNGELLHQDKQRRENQIQKLRHGQSANCNQMEMMQRLQRLRAELKRDETEMHRLTNVNRKVDLQNDSNSQTEMELHKLQQLFSTKERELRTAVSKVDTLRKQLEMIQERRKAAHIAATAMQRELTGQQASTSGVDVCDARAVNANMSRVNTRIDELITNLRVDNRPTNRPQANVEPFSVKPPLNKVESPESGNKGMTVALSAFEEAMDNEQNRCTSPREGKAPSPPRQYANSSFIHEAYTGRLSSSSSSSEQGLDAQIPGGKKVNINVNKRQRMPFIQEDANAAQPPDLIPNIEKRQFGNEGETGHLPRDADSIHIRDNNVRAVKRRSWAQHSTTDSTQNETNAITAILIREQQKGKSHVNLSWIFEQLPQHNINNNNNNMQTLQETPKNKQNTPQMDQPVESEMHIRPPPPYPFHKQQTHTEMVELEQDIEKSSNSSDDSDSTSKVTVIDVKQVEPKSLPKGILRPPGKPKHGRNIQFDPLAILLDAALEGELELVKLSAKRMCNVSECNDEGITALHNAICAGHYEIVRFLVEANADVNAQDSDGWTPLHCAASCNNLPMVKFLVERGACVFATTVSDHETPADKCEEEEDGFEAVSQFLYSMQEKMGVMNVGRVFCAYSHESEREDELELKEGDELTILNRHMPKEKAWWWASTQQNGLEGFVPRNYLALYPRLSTQNAMRMFAQRQFTFEEIDEIQSQIDKNAKIKALMNRIPNDGTNSI